MPKGRPHGPVLCRHCRAKAVINMRQHKLALCDTHFVAWVHKRTQHVIEKQRMFSRDERILVAVSGGKDSLALWDVLLDLGYQADGLYIGLGIDGGFGYSDQSHTAIQDFITARGGGLTLHTVDVAQTYGAPIPVAARMTNRGREKPCSLCGLTKRHIMNRVARDEDYDALATGHNLDDEVAVLLGNTLQWAVDYLARQGPVMPPSHPGLARKVKPLYRFYEREMAAYCIVRGINYVYDECPFSKDASTLRYKDLLNQLEAESPGIKMQFYLRFLHAKKQHNLFQSVREDLVLLTCPTCAQPTTLEGSCAFCRTWERITSRLPSAPDS